MQVYKHVVVLLINERRWQCFLCIKKQTVIANCKTSSPIIPRALTARIKCMSSAEGANLDRLLVLISRLTRKDRISQLRVYIFMCINQKFLPSL